MNEASQPSQTKTRYLIGVHLLVLLLEFLLRANLDTHSTIGKFLSLYTRIY